MASSILVLVTKPPYGVEEAFAGLRLALAMGVNGQKTSVLFVEDGVYNAVSTQRADALKMPSNIEATKELYDFDVPVYVAKKDLEARNISIPNIFDGLKVVSPAEVRALIDSYDVITTF